MINFVYYTNDCSSFPPAVGYFLQLCSKPIERTVFASDCERRKQWKRNVNEKDRMLQIGAHVFILHIRKFFILDFVAWFLSCSKLQ